MYCDNKLGTSSKLCQTTAQFDRSPSNTRHSETGPTTTCNVHWRRERRRRRSQI